MSTETMRKCSWTCVGKPESHDDLITVTVRLTSADNLPMKDVNKLSTICKQHHFQCSFEKTNMSILEWKLHGHEAEFQKFSTTLAENFAARVIVSNPVEISFSDWMTCYGSW